MLPKHVCRHQHLTEKIYKEQVAGHDPATPTWKEGMFPLTPHRLEKSNNNLLLAFMPFRLVRELTQFNLIDLFPQTDMEAPTRFAAKPRILQPMILTTSLALIRVTT